MLLVRLAQLCLVIEFVAHICLLKGILNNFRAGIVAVKISQYLHDALLIIYDQ